MSLRRALEDIPSDRHTESALRELLAFVRHHPGEHMSVERMARATGRDPVLLKPIVEHLVTSFVLDFDGASGTYAYRKDALLDVEVDRYVMRTDRRAGRVQHNVERFRQRYGDR